MLFLIGNLIESEAAVFNRTEVGFFPSMDSQMVKQIVPFFENHFALVVVLVAYESALSASSFPVYNAHSKIFSALRHVVSAREEGLIDCISVDDL